MSLGTSVKHIKVDHGFSSPYACLQLQVSFGNSVFIPKVWIFPSFFVNKKFLFSSWLTENRKPQVHAWFSTDEIRKLCSMLKYSGKVAEPWETRVRLLPIHAHASDPKVTEGSRRGRENKSPSSGENFFMSSKLVMEVLLEEEQCPLPEGRASP